MTTAPAALDPRTNAFRPDLADERLRGAVAAERYAAGTGRVVAAPVAGLRRRPDADSGLDTEALFGETVHVFEERADGWCWVQLESDGYVGWMPAAALRPMGPPPTHRVTALRTFAYAGPDLKTAATAALSMGSMLALGAEAEARGTRYRELAAGGWVVAGHVGPVGVMSDFVAAAELFLHTPYLWGGRSSLGLDCSGLVQLSLVMAGVAAPRDTDMQERALGRALPAETTPARGDLVFWPGHVGIMVDGHRLIHANGHYMQVTAEPLDQAIERIRRSGNVVSSIKRLVI